jgi:modulator of FtsH protease HflC
MKRNTLTLMVGSLLILLFALLLFTFQVRQTEVAVVTTFDRLTSVQTEPGLKWKWPRPIQQVYKFDKRIQNFEEDRFEETLTRDDFNLLVRVYAGWTISDPQLFFNSFPTGTAEAAHPALEGLLRSAKNAVVGQHPFAHFVSTDPAELKLVEIEGEILQSVQPFAQKNYGIDIHFLGFKKLGVPESVTEKVFDRMKAERQSQVEALRAHGEAQAIRIRSAAETERDEILAKAHQEASAIRSQADLEANKSYVVFQQEPELANFLQSMRALEEILKNQTYLILDDKTPPFDLLKKQNLNAVPQEDPAGLATRQQ